MRVNEIDKFRENFFDKVIKEQKEKENQLKRLQQQCPHSYSDILEQYQNGYQKRICSKCEHIAIKHLRVWEGTKHCIIS
jgi:hypothetical protein